MTTAVLSSGNYRIALFLMGILGASSSLGAEKRHFTVRDSVEMSYFGTVTESNPEHSYDDGAASPDGRYFIKMTHRGVLPEGELEGTIWLFDTDAVAHALDEPHSDPPTPRSLVRMSATVNGYTADFVERGNILFQLVWSNDSRYIYFLGRNGQENRQLFRVNVPSGDLETLSLENQDVMTYRVIGNSVTYLAGPDVDEHEEWISAGSDIPDDVIGTGTPLMSLLYPNFRGYAISNPIELEVWQVQGGKPGPVVTLSNGEALRVTARFSDVAVSALPDGSHEILTDKTLEGTNWAPVNEISPESPPSIHLAVRESLNEPPVLVATDTKSGKSRAIFDPNPQLAGILMAEVRVYEWKDSHDQSISGGLVIPPGFKSGQKYPLVIQTHGFHQDRFYRVGYSETANAGRALASRDIVVLQVAEPMADIEQPWSDLPRHGIDAYLAAIDELGRDGLIDPEKVGITGYSSTGLLATAALTHAPDRFAAALIANSDPLTITGFNSYVDSPVAGITEWLLGTQPYGAGIDDWLELSPAMSTENIRTPVLVFASDPWHLLSLWDLYATLRYQKKPVELHYIRTGRHNIKKPLQKLSHQEVLVDWFDFWLNGDDAASSVDTERFDRWSKLDTKTH